TSIACQRSIGADRSPIWSLVWRSPLSRLGGRGSAKAVEGLRVLDEDALAGRGIRRPYRKQVEQQSIVGLGLLGWVRPVAAPYHTLGRGLDVGLREVRDIGIVRWSDLGVLVGAGQLHPRFAP